ncbi:hypothetical protein [Rickettsia rhipicephali]|uniref:hypothetical protein n=1 Tax=Rickettsia rhipicephali TaxID=33992 RepID=UPI000310B404|nr:hypothetical protein [Rickettsia rhipicephali]
MVKGDTYAKDITIDAGKSAVFTGYNSRSLDIPSATVGGVKVPRATTKFNYKTKIVSENFKKGSSSNSSAEYTNAALVQAPINGGSHKFDDDVWLQKAVTGTGGFSPNGPGTGRGFGPNGPANVGGNPDGPNASVVTTPTSNVGANQLSTGGGGSFGGTTGYNSPSTGGSSYNSPVSGSDVYSPSTASSGQSGAGGLKL